MPYIIKFAHVIKQSLKPGLIFTLYSLKYEAFCNHSLLTLICTLARLLIRSLARWEEARRFHAVPTYFVSVGFIFGPSRMSFNYYFLQFFHSFPHSTLHSFTSPFFSIDEFSGRQDLLTLKSEKLDGRHVETLEEVLRRVQFRCVDLENCRSERCGGFLGVLCGTSFSNLKCRQKLISNL